MTSLATGRPQSSGGPFARKALQVNRIERDELAELITRAIFARGEEVSALYAVPLDMGTMVRTADTAATAVRELWQALFSLALDDESTLPQRVVKISHQREGSVEN